MKLTALMRHCLLLFLLLAGLFFVSCGKVDDLMGPTGEPGTLERVYSYPTIQGCGTCHGPGGQAEDGPDMSSASSFRNSLVNKNYDANYDDWFPLTAQCSNAGFPYIEPGSPDTSAVLAAISWEYAEGKCDGTHAYHSTQNATIDSNQALKDDLVQWIENGANP